MDPLDSLPSLTFFFTWQFPSSHSTLCEKWKWSSPGIREETTQLRSRQQWKRKPLQSSRPFTSLPNPTASYSFNFILMGVRNCHLASVLFSSHSLAPLKLLEFWESCLTFSWEVKASGCSRDARLDSLAKLRPGPSCPFLWRGTSEIRWTKICPESWKSVT